MDGYPGPYRNDDPTSFAWTSARERWVTIRRLLPVGPGILYTAKITSDDVPLAVQSAVKDVESASGQRDHQQAKEEGIQIAANISALRRHIIEGRPLADASQIGSSLPTQTPNKTSTWHNAPWLDSECFMYHLLHAFFEDSRHWRNYDVFSNQKKSAFRDSKAAVLELALRYKALDDQINSKKHTMSNEQSKILFREFIDISLWGNATDLSLLTNITTDDYERLQGKKARAAAEANLLVDDIDAAFDVLSSTQEKQQRRVYIVLDNAGFELFVDLILAGYLIMSGLTDKVVLLPKAIPWFVSDVVEQDFFDLLSALEKPQDFFNADLSQQDTESLQFLAKIWSHLHSSNQITLQTDSFWTRENTFWSLARSEYASWRAELEQSRLVIFKGDLNYRKLTSDLMWDPTTPFSRAIGPLSDSKINILSLRTCKADVVVNLPPGKDEELREKEGQSQEKARKWAWTGKYAVAQLYKGT